MAARHRRRSDVPWTRFGAAGGLLATAAVAVVIVNQTASPISVRRVTGPSTPAATVTPAPAPTSRELATGVTVTPGGGATDVLPDAVVAVSSRSGRLTAVTVTGATPSPLAGRMGADGRTWTATGGLAAASTYRVAATVAGRDGTTASVTSTFRTLAPTSTVTPSFTPADGSTVGVGEPVVLHFAEPVPPAAQATLLAHLSVAETRPVPSGWHWFGDEELHLRPEAFWPSGEQVTVTADADGWDVGGGVWGAGTVTDHVTIGAAHVSVANLATDQMTVTDDGAVVATYPISGGSPEYPTQDGIHIALDKEPVVHMVSGTVGIPTDGPGGYDEYVYNDVHISETGEYVHAAPWSVWAQGHENVSHGCINLSYGDSLSFYDFSVVGDVIEVVGGVRAPVPTDRGLMDWTLPWSGWTPAVVTAG